MIRFNCDQCGTAIEVPDEHAGKRGRCPGCKALVTIPSAPAGESIPSPAPPAPAPPAPAPPPAPPQAPAAPQILSPPPPVYAPVYARIPPPGPSKALAICALVFGCLGFIPLLALVGIVLGGIALIAKKPGKGMAATGLILGLVLGSGSTIAGLYFLGLARENARQTVCRGNLNSIGRAMHMYAADNDDRYPEDLKALIQTGSIWEGALKCPSARSGRECDYVYLKPERNGPYDAIAACERKGNHEGLRNVLYVDGSVRGMTESEFQRFLTDPENEAFAEHLRKTEGP